MKQKGMMVDMHCHVLPAVDDGSSGMKQTINMLRIAAAEGCRAIIATPHYKSDYQNADVDTLKHRMAVVEDFARKQGIPISIFLGSEVFYFDGLGEKLNSKEVCTLNDTDRVLIEFLPTAEYTYIRNSLDNVTALGFVPILAHVERYDCMVRDLEKVNELKQLGVEIQINVASIMGKIGRTVKKFCHELIRNQLVDYVGTDSHNDSGRAPYFQKCYQLLCRKYEKTYVDDIFYSNALEIVNAK